MNLLEETWDCSQCPYWEGDRHRADCSVRTFLPNSVKPEKCNVDQEQGNSAQRVCCGEHQGLCAPRYRPVCWLFPLVASLCCSGACSSVVKLKLSKDL